MEISAVFALFLLYGVASAEADYSNVVCGDFGPLRVRADAGETCSGDAVVDCELQRTVAGRFRSVFDKWWATEDEVCLHENLEEAAVEISKAAADLYADSISKVSCSGKGFGCGWSIAEGSSYATAVANSIAEEAMTAGGDAHEFCAQDVEDMDVAFYEAACVALSRSCSDGVGSVEVFRSELAELLERDMEYALLVATARKCSKGFSLAYSMCSYVGEANTLNQL